jgi:flagellar hook-associated protein 2
LSGVNFGTTPAVNDFKNFSVTVAGQTLNVTPAPATATLTDLASNLQSQLQSMQGTSDLTVTASPQTATLSGVSFANPPSVNDFKSLTVDIGNVTQQVSIPQLSSTNMSDLANTLQGLLQTKYNSTAISVTLDGSNNLVVSSALAPVSSATLVAATAPATNNWTASIGAQTASIAGVKFGNPATTGDFGSLSVTIGNSTQTITPTPGDTSLTALASDMQNKLQSAFSSSTLTVSVDANQNLVFNSGVSASPVTAASLSTNANDPSVGTTSLSSNSASISGISFATPPSTTDFSSLTVQVGGVTQTITPNLTTTNLSDMASALQSQLQTAFGTTLGPTISVTASDSGTLVINSTSGVTAASLVANPKYPSAGNATVNVTPATFSGVNFAKTPTTADFTSLAVSINGSAPVSITPHPSSATIQSLAADAQSQLRSILSSSTLTVTVGSNNNLVINTGTSDSVTSAILTPEATSAPSTGTTSTSTNNLTVSSASGKTISNVSLGPSASVTVGTPAGVSLGTSQTGTLSGVSFGSPAATTDFSSMTVEIGGVTQTITPNLTTTNLSDMASALQSQLQTAFGTAQGNISVTASGSGSLVISSTTSTVNYVTLTPKSGSSASGGTFSNNSIAGLSFGTTPSSSDFQSFSILVGGNPMTIYPSPSSADLPSLAANVQAQLNQMDASQFNGSGSDITVSVDGNGVMSFKSASGRSIADPQFIEFAATPDGISQAINAKGLGITSTVINTGTGSTPYEIMLASNVGSANKFTVSSSMDTTGATVTKLFGVNGVQNDIQSAQDAKLTVDGVSYTRTTNSINDILTGVTLSLNATTPTGSPATINLTRDTSTLVTNINAMVSAYNDAFSVLNAVSDPKSTLATYGGTLVGDSTVMLLKQKLRDMMLGQSSTPGTNIGSLWQMGISVDANGVLSVNSTTLTSALTNNFNDVVKTFTGNIDNSLALSSSTASGGLAGDAVKQLTTLLSATGPITSRSNDLTTQNQTYENDLSTLQVRMDALLQQYQTQFAAMDTLVGQTNADRTSLTATFNGMMAMYTNK